MTEPAPVPLLDLGPEIDLLWDELSSGVLEVMRSGHFILGPNVSAFEEEVAEWLGVRHAIGVNSGTDALVIALRALGVGEGDEVITSPFTFFATAESISLLGAKPVFADVERESLNLDPLEVERALSPRTRAILPVHLFGQPADMDGIRELAASAGVPVLEDAAQAFGAAYGETRVGALGDAAAFSFFPTKNLGAYGDGGLITTDSDEVARLSRMLRVHGSVDKYRNEILGYNSRLDEMQAAVLRVKFRRIEAFNDGRRQAARRYARLLADLPLVTMPGELEGRRHVFHQYTIRIGDGRRDRVQAALRDEGIASMIYYPLALHQLPVYADRKERHPVSEAACGEVLSLPIWPQITEDVQERVVTAIVRAFGT